MTVEIKPLSVVCMQELGKTLLEEHYEELTLNKEVVKLNVDWQKYRMMEQCGVLMALGAWENNTLIGYTVFFLAPHMHYQDIKMAKNDVLFLTKEKRKGSTGIRLIKESERVLKEKGVTKVVWHCKYGTVAGKVLEKLGYVNEEYSLGKIL